MSSTFVIEFENPYAVIEGKEKRSKLLKTNSPLYLECERKAKILKNTFGNEMGDKRMDFHLELIKDNPTDELLVLRAKEIEKSQIDSNRYDITQKSIGIEGPFVKGYGKTHITIGYFPRGLPQYGYYELLR
jgi:hypothetical protein